MAARLGEESHDARTGRQAEERDLFPHQRKPRFGLAQRGLEATQRPPVQQEQDKRQSYEHGLAQQAQSEESKSHEIAAGAARTPAREW